MAMGIGEIGTLLSGVGTAYGAYEQSKYAKDLLNLQKQNYEEEKKRRVVAQLSLNQGFEDSALFLPYKPKTTAQLPLGSV